MSRLDRPLIQLFGMLKADDMLSQGMQTVYGSATGHQAAQPEEPARA